MTRLLSIRELKTIKGIPYGPGSIRLKVRKGEFPRPIQIGPQRKMWREADVEKWIEDRAAAPLTTPRGAAAMHERLKRNRPKRYKKRAKRGSAKR